MKARVFNGLSYHEYDELPGLRWSLLRHMRTSPRQYLYAERNAGKVLKQTDDMIVGSAIHTGALEPSRMDRDFTVWKERRNSNAWKAFAGANATRHILTSAMLTRATTAIQAVKRDPVAREYLGRGMAEYAVQWTDISTGILCKARCDQVNGHLIDLKSSKVIVPKKFVRLACELGYPEQLAFYRAGLRANRIEVAPEAIIIVVQTAPAWDVVVYEVGPTVLDAAWLNVRALLDTLVTCRREDAWPGLAPAPLPFEPPPTWFGERLTLNMDGQKVSVGELR